MEKGLIKQILDQSFNRTQALNQQRKEDLEMSAPALGFDTILSPFVMLASGALLALLVYVREYARINGGAVLHFGKKYSKIFKARYS